MVRYFVFIFMLAGQVFGEAFLLDLETAWQRVVSYSPSIAAADAEIGIRMAEKCQVSLLPNPIGIIEADNLGVTKPDDETDPPDTTFAISQLIELGGKRCARASFAAKLADIAFWESQIERCDLNLALRIAFLNVRMAQERAQLAQERVCIFEKIVRTVEAQVASGKVSSIQQKKALIVLMAAQVAFRESTSALVSAKKGLSSMWGSSNPDFDGVIYPLYDCCAPPCFRYACEGLFQTPDFAKAQAAICAASQNLKLQKANSIPDLTLTLGYTIFNDSCQHGWVVGAEMPLPFFDRNQGSIQRAYIERSQAQFQMDEIVRQSKEQILLIHERLVSAFENAQAIKNGALVEAMDTFELIQTGYENGKIEYLELLDAQKMLFEIQERYIEILYDYHLGCAELYRLSPCMRG